MADEPSTADGPRVGLSIIDKLKTAAEAARAETKFIIWIGVEVAGIEVRGMRRTDGKSTVSLSLVSWQALANDDRAIPGAMNHIVAELEAACGQ